MKKQLLTLFFGWVLANASFAQDIPFTITPSSYTALDEVTVTINTAGTFLEGQGPFQLWMFSNVGDAPTNNGFCDGPSEPVAQDLGGGQHAYTFRIAEAIGKPAGQITSFGIIFKSATPCGTRPGGGNLQTQNINLTPQPLEYVERVGRLFPRLATDKDIVTFYYNKTLEQNTTLAALTDIYVYAFTDVRNKLTGATRFVQIANWPDVGSTPSLKLVNQGSGIYSLTIVPRQFFPGVAANEEVTAVKLVVRNVDGSTQSNNGDFIFPLNQ